MSQSLLSTARLPSLPLLLTVVLLFVSLASSTCFSPDGKLEKNVEYVPCANDPSDPLYTICCATNRSPDRGPDICVPNGLCEVGLKKGEAPKANPVYTKPQCTNSNYDEPGCLHVCGTDNLGFITPCDTAAGPNSKRWCCGYEDTDCCSRSDSQFIFPDFADALVNETISSSSSSPSTPTLSATPSVSQPSNSVSNVISSTAASSTTNAPIPASTNDTVPASTNATASASTSGTSTGLSTGAKVGLGVGIPLGAVALLACGIFLGRYLSTRRNATAPNANSTYDAGGYQHGVVTYASKADAVHDAWLSGRRTPTAELADDKIPGEMAVENDPVEKY